MLRLRKPTVAPNRSVIRLTESTRALRADATRNRDQLLEVATRVFVAADGEPSMRAIAREAGVGIGTLYRHFPTREALVDAVYRDQVTRLTSGADTLLAELPPATALRRWMDLFGSWIATKNGMLETLLAMIESGEIAHVRTRVELHSAIDRLLDAGKAAGEFSVDITADDIAASLIGIFTVAPLPEHEARAARLLDILLNGLQIIP
jgi:AcrR family transcriptional regulator